MEKVGNLLSIDQFIFISFVTLKKKDDKELKKRITGCNWIFFCKSDCINEHQHFPEDEIDQSSDDCMKNPAIDIIQNYDPLDEKPAENCQNSQISDETPAIAINSWDKLPDETVKKNIDTGH